MRTKKRCAKCQTEKKLEEFYKQKGYRDERGSYCKDCKKEMTRGYHERNRPARNAASRTWYNKNRKKHMEISRRSYLRNQSTVLYWRTRVASARFAVRKLTSVCQ